uniref:Uncharacterized protein n=1 Tax=Arion vulgaris TaxID=1028688 RepID=A0A0B7A9X5_9EUPU
MPQDDGLVSYEEAKMLPEGTTKQSWRKNTQNISMMDIINCPEGTKLSYFASRRITVE